MSDTYPDREFTAFIDRVQDLGKIGFMRRNRHIESPRETWVRRYDRETEGLRDLMQARDERKAS